MAVYVTPLANDAGFGAYRKVCVAFLYADNPFELDRIASLIGLLPHWRLGNRIPYFAVTPAQRLSAIGRGAIVKFPPPPPQSCDIATPAFLLGEGREHGSDTDHAGCAA